MYHTFIFSRDVSVVITTIKKNHMQSLTHTRVRLFNKFGCFFNVLLPCHMGGVFFFIRLCLFLILKKNTRTMKWREERGEGREFNQRMRVCTFTGRDFIIILKQR